MQLLICLVESMRVCEAENTKTVKFVKKFYIQQAELQPTP